MRDRTPRRLVTGAFAAAVAASALAGLWGGCSLGNVRQDDCSGDAECVTLFGLGSRCAGGFCTTPSTCNVDEDCIAQFNRGSCVKGICESSCDGQRPNGAPCYACAPTTAAEFYNACTSSSCEPFDQKRLTNLPADGKLPPLP